MKKTPILTLALGAALVATLAGCTADQTTSTADSTPKATATAGSDSNSYKTRTGVAAEKDITPPSAKAEASCKDGEAVIDQSTTQVSLKEYCAKVTVTAGNSIIDLDDVGELVVKGNINRIEVGSAKKITVAKSAKANDIIHDAGAAVDDKGDSTRFQEDK